MSKEEDGYSLPASSCDLCFDENAFIQPSFSADRFLQEHRGRASLEAMRDDLGSYLKVLRSATLDLIDHDYADFVGLSSSLVGLDKAVEKIRDPLGQLREEVMTVQSSLEEAVRGIALQLELRGNLRKQRSKIEASEQAFRSLKLLESLLDVEGRNGQSSNEMNQKLPIAERSTAECSHLLFCLKRCESADQLNLRAQAVHANLMVLLEGMLLQSIAALGGSDNLGTLFGAHNAVVRLLQAYAALDEVHMAEQLVGERIIAPALDAVFVSHVPQESNQAVGKLSEIYHHVLSIVDQKLGRVLHLTANGTRNLEAFDFLAHSFWPQFVNKLELNLPHIYAPGNPDIFHERFGETVKFLERLEKWCGSDEAVERLRASSHLFLTAWNLPVYFQIRFQQLAGVLESTLPCNGFDSANVDELMEGSGPSHGGFWLRQTSTCWQSIVQCWDVNTFIPQLGHRFWGMSLQLVARYCQWCRDILGHHVGSMKPGDALVVGASSEAVDCEQSAEQGSDAQPMHHGRTLPAALLLPLCLHRDACQLSMRLENTLLKISSFALGMVKRGDCEQQAISDLLQRSLGDTLKSLAEVPPLAARCIVEIISQGSLAHLRQCRDIPRLYRRTNRLHPTHPRPYVSAALSLALSFRSIILASFSPPSSEPSASYDAWVSTDLLNLWMQDIFSEITVQYHLGVLEVLTSVHKMEESLRRLKRIKGRGAVDIGESSSADDDDKIRAQLTLDVHHFCKQVEYTGVHKYQVKQLMELVELVDNAISKRNIKPC